MAASAQTPTMNKEDMYSPCQTPVKSPKTLGECEEAPLPTTCWGRFTRWYLGHSGIEGKKRYCGARLSKCAFIAVHIVLFIVLVLVITIPVMVCNVIPGQIQGQFDTIVKKLNEVSPTKQSMFVITSSTVSSGNYILNANVAAMAPIGGTVEIVGTPVMTLADTQGKAWGKMELSSVSADTGHLLMDARCTCVRSGS